MSALLPILDISRVHCDVRYVPKADVHQSVENLVSAGNHGRRNSNAECPGCFQVNCQLEFSRSLDRKLSRLLSFKNAVDIRRRAPKIISQVISVGQQTAEFSEDTLWIDGREMMACRQRCDLRPTFCREGIRHHDQAATRLLCLLGDDGF